MTPQEQQMLDDLTSRINQTQLQEKDPEAEQFLTQKLGRNPDALYIMAQTTLVQGYALEQAQKQLADARAQIEQLQAQAQQQPKHATSFLGNLFGAHDEPTRPAPSQMQPYTPVPNAAPPAGSYYAQQQGVSQYAQPQYGGSQFGGPQYPPSAQGGAFQQGGFLRSAMQTATGVAAGALAFEGIESLMHGFGGHSGGGMGFGDSPREEIVNNYYGDSSPAEHHEHGRDFADSNDIEDRRGDSQSFADTSDDNGNSSDDSGSDDSGSADDGGSFDPGGNDTSF